MSNFDQSDYNDFAQSGKPAEERPPVTCGNCTAETQGVVEYDPDDEMHYWYCDSDKPSCRHSKGGPGPTIALPVARFDEWQDFFPQDFQKFHSENDFY